MSFSIVIVLPTSTYESVHPGKSTTLRRRFTSASFFFFVDMKSLSPPCRISTTVYAHCLSGGTYPLARRYPTQHRQVNTHHPRCTDLSFNVTAHITLLLPSFKGAHHIPPASTKPPTRAIQWEWEWERHNANLWLFFPPACQQTPAPLLAPVQPRFGRRLRV